MALALVSGCGDDLPPQDVSGSSSTSSPDPDTGSGDGTGTGTGPITEGTGDDGSSDGGTGVPAPELGATPNVLCEAAVAELQIVIDHNASGAPDPMAIAEAYLGPEGEGTALQQMVQTYGGLLGRVEDGVLIDDAAILDALAAGTPEAMIDVETRVVLVISQLVRARTAEVAGSQPDVDRDPALLYALWDDAYCYFDAVVRPHAQAADALGGELEPIEADMQHGFEWGHGGIMGPEASFAIDEWSVPAAKQVVEKSMFRAYDRLVVELAAQAQATGDPLLARRALGLFQVLEDRLLGRNTPGVDLIEADLGGDPSLIDPAIIRHELDIAWAKRVRRYCSHAIDDDTTGTPSGHTGGNEGRTYAKVIIPTMEAMLDGFDGATHLQHWDAWIEAIEADDAVAAQAASDLLVPPVCELQGLLGIAECTGSEDQPPPG
ncbi:MAG: hypothetical protein H6712_00380 [Myxococcales bacterium]|nr:hypothetical protein [Myxococcales bacterium]MCB9712281.1 hypothetical protein [Myxococcales bacterium]